MADKRIEKPGYSIVFLLFGLMTVIASGLFAMMYPSLGNTSLGILGAGVGFIAIAFVMSPGLFLSLISSRKSWLWINDILLVMAIVGIGIMLTYIGHRRHYRYDFTRDRLFSLSDSTIKQLQGLKKNIVITAFYPTGSLESELVSDLLAEYKRYTEKISYKMVDPFRDPLTTKSLNIRMPNTVVVQSEGNRKDIFDEEMFMRPNPMMRNVEKPKFQGEQALTSALINVTSGSKRKVVFIKGHEEPSISAYNSQGLAGFQQFLVKENYDVAEASLMEPIASEASVLLIMSPKKEFHPAEIQALKSFVNDRKGKLFVSLDPDTGTPEFNKFLTETYGVIPNAEYVINPRGVNQNPTIIIPQYEAHTIVKGQMERKSGALMQLARGLSVEQNPNWKSTIFLKSPADTYAKRQAEAVFQGKLEFDAKIDIRGPINVGVALEGQGNASGSRAVVFGDTDFATNMLLQVQGNSDLMVNSVNWLAGQEQLISIHPKQLEFSQLDMEKMDREAVQRILIRTVIASPLAVIMIGGLVWFFRRRM